MKFLSESMTSASGSIGGATYSHNRFGMYRRARRVPVNPNTTFQQSQRDALSEAAAAWRDLTAPQRAAWEAYAAASPTTNPLGQTVHLSGSQWFIATSSLNIRLGAGVVAAAPITPGRAAVGMPTVVIDASSASITASLIAAAMEAGFVGFFLGDAQSAGVSFFAGPYQLRGSSLVTAGVATVAAGLLGRNGSTLTAGQIIPVRIAGFDTDGRLSTVWSNLVTVVA